MLIQMDEAHDQAQQIARLRQFLFWLLLSTVATIIALAALAAQVAERTAALQTALTEVETRADEQARLLVENEQQRTTMEQALRAIERSTARQLVLDITGVPVVDSQVAQGLIAIVQASRLLGSKVILVGIRPEVAQAIVGLDLRGMATFSDLQTAVL